jgi:hypothetical protein
MIRCTSLSVSSGGADPELDPQLQRNPSAADPE